MALKVSAQKAAEIAIASIGRGYDITNDLRLKYYKGDANDLPLIEFGEVGYYDVALPGGIHIPNVSKLINCRKGERLRHISDVISFEQMSIKFNHEMSLSSKIPSGFFNAMFDFSGCWQKDEVNTKTLAFDGIFITLYTVSMENSLIKLREHVKKSAPTSWEPAAFARFIKTFGTHVIVGVTMGGKDVLYVKEQHSSIARPADVHGKLKKMADEKFSENSRQNRINSKQVQLNKEDTSIIHKRRGGREEMNLSHAEWLHTLEVQPDVVSMSFIPITSFLTEVSGSGFLTHAINLYLQYKPPLKELQMFFEFELPRLWAPVFNEFPYASRQKQQINSFLQFNFLGPKLYVNTIPVDVGMRPVTGLRLYLEGKRNNRLAVYLQHLASLPRCFQLVDVPDRTFCIESYDKRCFKKVRWLNFSRVCTTPIEPYNDHSIVTGAQLQVEKFGRKKVLFLRLHFCTVLGTTTLRHTEWDESSGFAPQLGAVPAFIRRSSNLPLQPKSHTQSTVYTGGPPVPNYTPKLSKYVDIAEKKRGPEDPPGYWVVSSARLVVDGGKIALWLKYSLLTAILPDDNTSGA
ncbi:hypothetical protein DITRI_Ditri01bG0010700 [Diplodiscus trichospermus]